MLHRWIGLAAFVVLALVGSTVRADDDEPTFLDKKLSYWMGELAKGKTAAARRRGMIGVEQIGHYGSRKVVPALVKALREDGDKSIRAAAARATGRTVAKALEQARLDKKEELPRFDTARDALALALRMDKADEVRAAAALAIGDIGPDARGAVGALALALKDKNPATVTAAASALRRMGSDAKEAETDLQAVVGNAKAEVEARMDSAIALGQIRADVPSVLPTLRTVLADVKTDVKIRRAVATTLGRWGKEAGAASAALGIVLIDAKNSPDELRRAAVTALSQMGAEAEPAVLALIKAVGDSDRIVACLSMQTLGKMGRELDENREKAVVAVLKATENSNIEVCVSAIETLGAMAAEGLSTKRAEVLKRLDEIIRREGRKAVREAAQAAHKKLEPKKKVKPKERD